MSEDILINDDMDVGKTEYIDDGDSPYKMEELGIGNQTDTQQEVKPNNLVSENINDLDDYDESDDEYGIYDDVDIEDDEVDDTEKNNSENKENKDNTSPESDDDTEEEQQPKVYKISLDDLGDIDLTLEDDGDGDGVEDMDST